jgi:hypothetical protein
VHGEVASLLSQPCDALAMNNHAITDPTRDV